MNIIFLFWLLFFLAIGLYFYSKKNIQPKTQQQLLIADDIDLLESFEKEHFKN
jgi:hypothetical protein